METKEKPEMEVKKEETVKESGAWYILVFFIGAVLGLLTGYIVANKALAESVVENQDSVNIILVDSITSLNAKLDVALEKCEDCEKTKLLPPPPKETSKVSAVKSTKEMTQKVIVEVVVKNPETPEVIAVAKEVKPISTPTKASVEIPPVEEPILACFCVNGEKDMYFPHYAMLPPNNKQFSNAVSNGQGGFNLKLKVVEGISGDEPAITREDKIIFAPLSFFTNYYGGEIKYIIASFNGHWGGVNMKLQEVDGKKYFIYDYKQ